MFEAVRRLQETINRVGLGGATLSLPAPRMLSLPSPESSENKPHEIFVLTVTDKDILEVSRDLFVSGFYSEAVENAYKLLDERIQKLSKLDLSGTPLMERVFSPSDPILPLSELTTESQKSEQKGYHRLFAGSMLGIRNPCAHTNNWIDDPKIALEVIIFCQHLLAKANAAVGNKKG